jgi:WASH complex subunit CCDC53
VEGLDAAPSTSETETRAPPPTDAREATTTTTTTTTTNPDDERADASDVDRTASAPSSAPSSAPPDDGGPKIRDDPRYSLYFKMVRMGVPAQAVKNKMALEGFSPAEADLLDDPDAPVPG